MTILAAVSCRGRVDAARTGSPPVEDSGGNATESDASTEPADATPSTASGAPGSCADPIHVSMGDTISGSTCGGGYVQPHFATPCDNGSPLAYFYVDAPAGAAISVNSTTPLDVTGYDWLDASSRQGGACAEPFEECSWHSTSFAPTQTNPRLFSVQVNDDDGGAPPYYDGGGCGDFTITVVSQ
jgi:hypothetical protein